MREHRLSVKRWVFIACIIFASVSSWVFRLKARNTGEFSHTEGNPSVSGDPNRGVIKSNPDQSSTIKLRETSSKSVLKSIDLDSITNPAGGIVSFPEIRVDYEALVRAGVPASVSLKLVELVGNAKVKLVSQMSNSTQHGMDGGRQFWHVPPDPVFWEHWREELNECLASWLPVEEVGLFSALVETVLKPATGRFGKIPTVCEVRLRHGVETNTLEYIFVMGSGSFNQTELHEIPRSLQQLNQQGKKGFGYSAVSSVGSSIPELFSTLVEIDSAK